MVTVVKIENFVHFIPYETSISLDGQETETITFKLDEEFKLFTPKKSLLLDVKNTLLV